MDIDIELQNFWKEIITYNLYLFVVVFWDM